MILSENIQDNQKMTGMNLNEAAFIILTENIQDNQKNDRNEFK